MASVTCRSPAKRLHRLLPVWLFVVATACTRDRGAELFAAPEELGPMVLVKTLEGEAATRSISGLHGGAVSAERDVVATYESAEGSAILYISAFADNAAAIEQLLRMYEGIAAGGTPFYHLSRIERDGGRVNLTIGMDQAHYFYASGRSVLWLTVPPLAAPRVLDALLSGYPPNPTTRAEGSDIQEQP